MRGPLFSEQAGFCFGTGQTLGVTKLPLIAQLTVVDGHDSTRGEHVKFLLLAKDVVDRLGHGMLGQQLLFPGQPSLAKTGEHWHRLLLPLLQRRERQQ